MHFRFWPVSGLLALGLFVSLGRGQDSAAQSLRRVEVSLTAAGARDKVAAELAKLGFLPERNGNGSTLRGRVPQAELAKIAGLEGVDRLFCGPIVAGPEKQLVNSYHVTLRCRLDSNRTARVVQWRDLVKRLEKVGFKKEKGWDGEEFYGDVMKGTIPASSLGQLRRERQVVSALLVPEGHQLKTDAPVMVRFELSPDLGAPMQAEVAEKTRKLLQPLGWVGAVGYDNRDHQRLVGWIPGTQLEALLRGKTSTIAAAPEDLMIEMALPDDPNPITAQGQVVVPFTLTYEPGTLRPDMLKLLEPIPLELSNVNDPKQEEERIVTGRVSTRLVPALQRVDNVRKVDVDPSQAVLKVNPILSMEVLPEPEGSEPPAGSLAPPPPSKVTADLQAQMQGDAAKPLRVEVVLQKVPETGTNDWMADLANAGGMFVDGRTGPLVSGTVAPADLARLAAAPNVATVRSARPTRAWAFPPLDPKSLTKLPVDFVPLGRSGSKTSSLSSLVAGKDAQRIAVVASDFRGYEQFVGKGLPTNTTLVDVTGERNFDLQVDGHPDDGVQVGNGVVLALALSGAIPAKEMVLLRTSPDAPYQVEKVMDATLGLPWQTAALRRREQELAFEKQRLQERQTQLSVERKLALDDFSDDTLIRTTESAFKEPLAKVRARFLANEISPEATKKELETIKIPAAYVDTYVRVWQYQKDQAAFDADQLEYNRKLARQQQFVRNAAKLNGLTTVLVGHWWPEGHPQLTEQPGLRFLTLGRGADVLSGASINWIQAVPRAPDQSWQGLFRDDNADQSLEFTVGKSGSRNQVNFLAWQPHSWSETAGAKNDKLYWQELPAGANVSLTLQWRELHSEVHKASNGGYSYRTPLVPMRIVVLKQRDPAAQQLPEDAFVVVAASQGLPEQLENTSRTAVYEASVRFQVPEGGGRYAVRIEGRQPESTLPSGVTKLPGSTKFEIQPKLMVDVVDPATRAKGRVTLQK